MLGSMPAHPHRCALVLAVATGPVGCYEGFDPMDPQVLAEVARSRGDAEGIALSGVYAGNAETLECGCEQLESTGVLSLCMLVAQLPGETAPPLTVVQADGTVQILLRPAVLDDDDDDDVFIPTLYGPLDTDGRLSAAGTIQADGLVAQGQVLARLDGTLAPDDTVTALEVEYQQRTLVQVFETADGLKVIGTGDLEVQDIDCRERIGLDLVWIGDLPEPVEP